MCRELSLDQVAQRLIQPGLEYLQRWDTHNFSGQHVPVPHYPHNEEFPPNTEFKSTLFLFIPTRQLWFAFQECHWFSFALTPLCPWRFLLCHKHFHVVLDLPCVRSQAAVTSPWSSNCKFKFSGSWPLLRSLVLAPGNCVGSPEASVLCAIGTREQRWELLATWVPRSRNHNLRTII